ncbi:MAG TPA: hypothetical protein VGJ73_06130 [Verrucomicrobiae bacterium]|jgi:hypothetical protein
MEPKEITADSIERATGISHQPPNSYLRDIFVVLIIAWAARLAFVCMVPAGARSLDAYAWEHQADLLKSGINPYQANHLFNWPPLWLQFVFLISKVAGFLNVSFFRVLQFCLILIESAVIIQVMRLIQRIAPAANARAIVIIGIAVNPVAILLVCQHCNFDVLMVFWVLLAAASLLRYNASGDLNDWLCACLFLGLGILTKTVPLALIPLLAGGFRKVSAFGRLLGVAFVLGPATLGMSIIYALAPSEVLHNVLEYRANGIYFGFPGFLHSMGMDHFTGCFNVAFYILGIGVMMLTWHYLWKHHSLGNRETILYIALALLAVPELGPGFFSQYYYWFLPFLVISYACGDSVWRKILIGFAIISALTFILEYGFIGTYGYNFLYILTQAPTANDLYHIWNTSPTPTFLAATHWVNWMGSPVNETIERLPLFVAMLTILAFGARILTLSLRDVRTWVVRLVGIYALCVAMVFAAAFGEKCLWPQTPPAGNMTPGQSDANATRN